MRDYIVVTIGLCIMPLILTCLMISQSRLDYYIVSIWSVPIGALVFMLFFVERKPKTSEVNNK